MDAVFDGRVELEAEVWRELEVLQPAAQLMANHALGRHETGHGRFLLLRVTEHADSNASLPQVGRHSHRRDADEPDPWILEIPPDDRHDLFAHLLANLIRAVAGHCD